MDIQITFRGLDRSEALTQHIEQLAQHLPVQSCRVVVEAPHRHGRSFRVHVELPAPRLCADGEDPDAFAAATVAFDAERRRFEDWAERRRKTH
jgi:Sigma 54 modulation protein / S30EA ribosomal protein